MSNPNIPNNELKFYNKEYEEAFNNIFKKKPKGKAVKTLPYQKGNKSAKQNNKGTSDTFS